MPRPTSKHDLLELSQKNYQKLWELIHSFSSEERIREFPAGTLNRNIRDVVAHLHHWHLLLMGWYEEGMKGTKPAMPAEGYTWKTLPALNTKIWEKYQEVDLETASALLETSFKKVQGLIQAHSDVELFEKKRYPWTGSTSLGAYLISATASHYDWARKLIKKSMR